MTKNAKPAEKAPFVPAAFDPSLADLAHITATAVTTVMDATAIKHATVTVTMDSSTLLSILTAARLHYYDHPHVDKPVDPSSVMADIAEQSNVQEKHWHWMMEDTIEVLSGRVAAAVMPDRNVNKDQDVANSRKHRAMFDKMDREEAEDKDAKEALAAACLDESEKPDALACWFKTTKSKPMSEKELLAVLVNLRRNQDALPWATSMRLFSTASHEAANTKKVQQKIALALAALK